MQSKAPTVAKYLAEVPADRRAALEAVRAVVRKSIDAGVEEGMQYGMIGWFIPHRVFPDGYHCDPTQPVPYASLASQKNHLALYLMCAYSDPAVEAHIRGGFKKAGKKIDMGKSCIRFKRLDDLDLPTIAEAIRMSPSAAHLRNYVLQVGPGAWKKSKPKAAAKAAAKPAAKPAAKTKSRAKSAAAKKK